MHLHVVFLSGGQRVLPHEEARAYGITSQLLKLRSLRSLMSTMEQTAHSRVVRSISLSVCLDQVDDEYRSGIESLIYRSPLNPEICDFSNELHANFEEPYIQRLVSATKNRDFDKVYIVDDVTLHTPQALSQMLGVHEYGAQIFGQSPIISPYDTIPNGDLRSDRVLLTCGERYWTTTLIEDLGFLLDRQQCHALLSSHPARLGASSLCLSPLPALAMRLNESAPQTRYLDWKELWDFELESPSHPTSRVEKRFQTPSSILSQHDLSAFMESQGT